jgi:preprotein translocase subunit SecD
MKRLQTIIITGSLPIKLDVVKMDTISPSLGAEFMNNIYLVGLLAVLAVSIVVSVRYRKPRVVIPLVLTIVSEIVLVLGFAALVGWNLDLAAIAGIIIVIGTAVDHLVVITDETVRGEVSAVDWKVRIKNALFIIMGAYFTAVASMIPLWFAGAGMLKGFAFTTIVGISFGVLIARPAYAAIVELLLKEE